VITMESVLKRGRTVWDRDALPEDEYRERVRLARAAMLDAELDALVLVGHVSNYGDATYFSGSVPTMNWVAVVVGAEDEPALVTASGKRELPFLASQTWLRRIVPSRSLLTGPAAGVIEALGPPGSPARRVGLCGAAANLDADAYRELVAALAGYRVCEADALMAGLRAVKRPRELVALDRGLTIARAAVADAAEAFASGAGTASAALVAERSARRAGARDVRLLADLGDRALAPVQAGAEVRTDQLVLYCAVEYLGYWAEAVSPGAPTGAAAAALEAMLEAAGTGATGGELAAAAMGALPGGERDVALGYGLGGGIGLSLAEAPHVCPGGGDPLRDGAVLALHVITEDAGRLTAAAQTVQLRGDRVMAL
jgi:Xaa-Pro aminopeptidase